MSTNPNDPHGYYEDDEALADFSEEMEQGLTVEEILAKREAEKGSTDAPQTGE